MSDGVQPDDKLFSIFDGQLAREVIRITADGRIVYTSSGGEHDITEDFMAALIRAKAWPA